jgi:hypothetical protein
MKGSSEAVRVEASLLARLLGLKLLKLDATVLVLPADVREASRAPAGRTTVTETSVDRRRLADALRSLDEGARLLEEARNGG